MSEFCSQKRRFDAVGGGGTFSETMTKAFRRSPHTGSPQRHPPAWNSFCLILTTYYNPTPFQAVLFSFSPPPQVRSNAALKIIHMSSQPPEPHDPKEVRRWIAHNADGPVPEKVVIRLLLKLMEILAQENNVLLLPSPIYIDDDIHGQLDDLRWLFGRVGALPVGDSAVPSAQQRPRGSIQDRSGFSNALDFDGSKHFLFMGDYVDRGYHSLNAFLSLVCLARFICSAGTTKVGRSRTAVASSTSASSTTGTRASGCSLSCQWRRRQVQAYMAGYPRRFRCSRRSR
jgi:hypothetical protein